ncbi:MAG: hypothetical protein V4597_17100 [Pseudomonadota bacterium]
MDKYVARQNVERFELMLAAAGSDEDMGQIRTLLAEAHQALRATQTSTPAQDVEGSGR